MIKSLHVLLKKKRLIQDDSIMVLDVFYMQKKR